MARTNAVIWERISSCPDRTMSQVVGECIIGCVLYLSDSLEVLSYLAWGQRLGKPMSCPGPCSSLTCTADVRCTEATPRPPLLVFQRHLMGKVQILVYSSYLKGVHLQELRWKVQPREEVNSRDGLCPFAVWVNVLFAVCQNVAI